MEIPQMSDYEILLARMVLFILTDTILDVS